MFRRRQQDLEKLSTEQIERSRKELSDLERRFLERVAQTNRTRTGIEVCFYIFAQYSSDFLVNILAPKDGRMAGFDEDGGFSPWMAQPDDADQGSHSSSGNGHRPHKDPILPQQRPMLHNTNGYNMSALSGIAGENIFMPGNYGASGTDASRFDDQGKIKSGRPSSLQNVNGNFYFDPANMSDYLKHQHSSGFPPRTDMNDMHNFEMPHVRTDMSSFGGRNPGSTSFPWFAPFGDPNAHDGADANNLNYTGYYEQNLKASASSVSLSEFAMSLWPSMNNLATAAEAVSSSSKSQSVSISPPEKNKVPGESVAGKKLGSLSRMDSLSNVALNELEAIATNEADNKSKPKTETSSGSEGKVKIEGAILYDVGYNIDDGNNTLSASKPRMENNEDKSLDVTVRSEGKLTEKLPEVRKLMIISYHYYC